jgi:RimJ/RimL family protein N-acetyltransferase
VELRGERIVLRPWRQDDVPAVYAACQDPDLQHWLPLVPSPYTMEHARAYVAAGDGPHSFAIEDAGRLVGSIALRTTDPGTGNLGYWVAREARGRGVATRALRRLCEYGLGELALQRLELVADPDNVASQRVAGNVGFRREGLLRSHLRHPDGRRRDSIMFSLLPGELR